MKHILITTIAALLVVGCGQSDHQHSHDDGHSHAEGDHHHAEGDIDDHDKELKAAEPVVEATSPEPPTAKAPDIDIYGAAYTGNIEAVKQYLAAGGDVNAKDSLRWTPLHWAIPYGRKEIVELLIDKGANVNAQRDNGDTPLDVAIEFKELETADLLRKHGGKTKKELEAAGK